MTDIKHNLGLNVGYLAELYERYLRDPHSVGPDLQQLFQVWSPEVPEVEERVPAVAVAPPAADADLVHKVLSLVQAIRDRGYLAASLDPLGLWKRSEPLLEPEAHGLSRDVLQSLPASLIPSPLASGASSAYEAIARLRRVYCGGSGYEFSHLRNVQERAWFQEAVESGHFREKLDAADERSLLERLTQVEAFEQFLHASFPGQKWFSIEGTDMLIPLLDEIVWQAARAPAKSLVIGMAHRGRLNVLTHIFGKAYEHILSDFMEGQYIHETNGDSQHGWMSDVKYHMGARSVLPHEGPAGDLQMVLLPNPSHLELVDPVVVGATRALQDQNGSTGVPSHDQDSAIAVLIHGDAAFAGQGVVAETLNLSQLAGYKVGGTIHIITNNQIGFTAEPQESQSTLYCSDLARGFDMPVIHVNADDVDACLESAYLAFAYRERFHKDIFIDLVGYRRYGHNEGDEPTFTQPVMYEAIRNHPTIRTLYAQKLIKEGVVTQEEVDAMLNKVVTRLRRALSAVPRNGERGRLREKPGVHKFGYGIRTAVPAETLVQLNKELGALPQGFTVHPKLERPLQRRQEALTSDGRIDWAHAEALAFASLLAEGLPVRITGQDTERGTFSQRHAVLHDVRTGARHIPLQAMPSARAPFSIYNSPLSEAGVLGFEYGYTLGAPGTLVLWEAQFGDFSNNAQSVVDEFIVSGQSKWGQRSGLVLLLPHGFEGQGPNHSSAHLERFLQLAAGNNIRVAYPTTAAQYFHLLRRQAALIKSDPHPLVVMTAKSLLRHPLAASGLQELAAGKFHPVIDDQRTSHEDVRRVILCSGKVFVDLVTSDEYARAQRVAVVRIEELYPFPSDQLSEVLSRYPNVEEVFWVQEEPQNRGAWSFVAPRIRPLLKPEVPLIYVGRPERPSPAEGTLALHKVEQARVIREALSEKAEPTATSDGVRYAR